MNLLFFLLLFGDDHDLSAQIPKVKRVFVDRLSGGESAAQMRDLIITALENSKLFVITENQERADAFLRGSAEDLIYTEQYKSSENVSMRGNSSDSEGVSTDSRYNGASGGNSSRSSRSIGTGIAGGDSSEIKERRHEALATVRLVNKDGDVLWSTTQESKGAKFHGASADVAEKVAKQLAAEFDRVKKVGSFEVTDDDWPRSMRDAGVREAAARNAWTSARRASCRVRKEAADSEQDKSRTSIHSTGA